MHQSIYHFKKGIYGWLALVMLIGSVILYISHDALQPPNGGTWQGYVLGVLAALLVFWLAALGIRKRSYASKLGTVQGWTSAHVYLGVSVMAIATLHSAAQLNWNIHSLAYVLMVFVVLSGFAGLYGYTRYPYLLSANKAGRTNEEWFAELAELNKQIRGLAQQCEASIATEIETAVDRTRLGGGVLAQLFALDGSMMLVPGKSSTQLVRNRDQQPVINSVAAEIPKTRKQGQAEILQKLLSALCRRQQILKRLRRDVQLRAWLQLWLFIHIPATFALLLALLAHIVTVFFFW